MTTTNDVCVNVNVRGLDPKVEKRVAKLVTQWIVNRNELASGKYVFIAKNPGPGSGGGSDPVHFQRKNESGDALLLRVLQKGGQPRVWGELRPANGDVGMLDSLLDADKSNEANGEEETNGEPVTALQVPASSVEQFFATAESLVETAMKLNDDLKSGKEHARRSFMDVIRNILKCDKRTAENALNELVSRNLIERVKAPHSRKYRFTRAARRLCADWIE